MSEISGLAVIGANCAVLWVSVTGAGVKPIGFKETYSSVPESCLRIGFACICAARSEVLPLFTGVTPQTTKLTTVKIATLGIFILFASYSTCFIQNARRLQHCVKKLAPSSYEVPFHNLHLSKVKSNFNRIEPNRT